MESIKRSTNTMHDKNRAVAPVLPIQNVDFVEPEDVDSTKGV
jgi:hypothetical protein